MDIIPHAYITESVYILFVLPSHFEPTSNPPHPEKLRFHHNLGIHRKIRMPSLLSLPLRLR